MARYQAIVAYDGTRYHGFQRQRQGSEQPTVQDDIEAVLRRLGWRGGSILAAGRTDAGVHAHGQVIAFDIDWRHPSDTLRNGLNALLPADIAVHCIREVGLDFHPRFDAVARRYRYRIYCMGVRCPLRDRDAWRVWPCIDFDAMQQAACRFIGTHDFASFGTSPIKGGTTIRTVVEAGWREVENHTGESAWEFDVLADSFLYRMVRRMVHLQVEIGQSRLAPEIVGKLLGKPEQMPIQALAPARGLVLVEVVYPPDVFDDN